MSVGQKWTRNITQNGQFVSKIMNLFCHLENYVWSRPVIQGICPSPRSLHTATLIGDYMYVFGGWVPLYMPLSSSEEQNSPSGNGGSAGPSATAQEKEWKCTNTLARLNISEFIVLFLEGGADYSKMLNFLASIFFPANK